MKDMVFAILAFGFGSLGLRCPWCGKWWPLWGNTQPRQCKKCNRQIFTLL